MREQVRNMDRAMSNIESMPGGFNALRQFHSQMQVGWRGCIRGEVALEDSWVDSWLGLEGGVWMDDRPVGTVAN